MNKSRSVAEKRVAQLPNWLWSNSNVLPSMYRRIWDAVKEERPHLLGASNQGELLVDTKKVFPLLLTSQLPTEVLGYIWGLANQKYAGKLTEQELYVVLALVAVAQTSYPFTNLEVLHLLPGPPEPRLNLTLIYPNVSQIAPHQEIALHSDDFGAKHKLSSRSLHKAGGSASVMALPGLIPNHSHMGETRIDSKMQIVPAPQQKLINDASSDSRHAVTLQTDGKVTMPQSSLDSSDDFSDFQSAPVPQTTPSIPIWDSKQGSAIGSRLANHNLGVKKTGEKQRKIGPASSSGSKTHGISRTATSTAEKAGSSVGVIGGKESIPSVERLGDIFPKCALKNQAKTVILKDTAIRNNEQTRPIGGTTSKESSGSAIEKIEIPPPTRQISSKFIPPKDSENSAQDLMNLQQVEDKYSALRILVDEPNLVESNTAIVEPIDATSAISQSDDFGDFVSAEQSETFAPTPSTKIASSSLFGAESTSDLFSEFERYRSASAAKKQTEVLPNLEATSEAFGNLEIGASPERHSLDDKYDGLTETEKVVQKEDTISVNSIELGNGTIGVMTRSNSVPSLDLKSFLSPSTEDEQQQVENMHQLIYWEWKQYMESCVLLLQTAANVFSSITSDVILHEVVTSAQGYNFLSNLAEVAAVCRRVNFSHKEMEINIMGFDDLLMEIDRIWAEMEPFYANIPIVTELPVWPLHQAESSACCALCLTVVTSGRIVYNDNNYHVTCANLWLNCVNHNLPALRYPPASFIPHSVAIASTGGSQI